MRFSSVYAAIVGITFLTWGCEEVPPIIKSVEKPLLDTTYQASVPAAQTKTVLLADITGVNCVNCPRAAEKAISLKDANPGLLEVISVYPNNNDMLTAPWPGYDTLVTNDANDLIGMPVPSLPKGLIDNVDYNGSKLVAELSWPAAFDLQKGKTTPINITVNAKWIASENRARVEMKLQANKNIPNNLLYVIAITQDEIVGKQADGRLGTGYNDAYVFNHVLRKTVTSPAGNPINGPLVAGQVIEKHYYVNQQPRWIAAHMACMVWVMDATTREVLHVAKAEYK